MLTIALFLPPPSLIRYSMILNSIEQTAWPGQPPAPLEEEEGGEMAQQPAAAADDDLTPLLAVDGNGVREGPAATAAAAGAFVKSPPPLRPHRGKPKLRRGTLAHQTTLGEMPLRVGQPYGFIHQGDVEHIWSVDEIR